MFIYYGAGHNRSLIMYHLIWMQQDLCKVHVKLDIHLTSFDPKSNFYDHYLEVNSIYLSLVLHIIHLVEIRIWRVRRKSFIAIQTVMYSSVKLWSTYFNKLSNQFISNQFLFCEMRWFTCIILWFILQPSQFLSDWLLRTFTRFFFGKFNEFEIRFLTWVTSRWCNTTFDFFPGHA